MLPIYTTCNYSVPHVYAFYQQAITVLNEIARASRLCVSDTGDPTVLNQVMLPIIELGTCRDWYEGVFSFNITEAMVCAGQDTGGIDTCYVGGTTQKQQIVYT